MNQLSMFSNITEEVVGLIYIPEYISLEQEFALTQMIDSNQWTCELKRRVQHYGYKYDYKSHNIAKECLGAMPHFVNALCEKLCIDKIYANSPNQVIINEYSPGQGINPHIDCIKCFGDTVCSLSLGSNCVMNFCKDDKKIALYLEKRSLVILQKDARYLWKHSIDSRKKDKYYGDSIARSRRISMTFRNIIL